MLTDDDVGRLDVAMQHPSRVGVVDRVADVHEPAEQLTQRQRLSTGIAFELLVRVKVFDGIPECVPLDESHRVIRPAAVIAAEAVHRHDSRVLEPARDLGFEHESGAAGGIVGLAFEDLLQGDLTIQLCVQRDENFPKTTAGMRSKDPEPPTRRLRCARVTIFSRIAR